MRGRPAAVAALAAAALLAVAGCSSSADPAPPREPEPPPQPGSGYFVGTGPGGIGATLDLEARDDVTAAVDAALRARDGTVGQGPVVGIASVVNEGPAALPAPSFIATFPGGGAAPLLDAGAVVASGSSGPAARRALRLLGTTPRVVAPGSARTMYVVLRGAAAGDVETVRMTVVPGRPVTMRARSR